MARAAPILDESWPRTVAAFEAWRALQPDRWEFVNGQPSPMAPASMRHSVIKRNVFRLLDRALASSACEVLVDGPQIRTEDISAIPDVVVTCAPLDLTSPVIAAPTIIVEVMSPSTAGDDHGLKWLTHSPTICRPDNHAAYWTGRGRKSCDASR